MQFSGLPKDVANLALKSLSSENGENGTIALKMPAEIIVILPLAQLKWGSLLAFPSNRFCMLQNITVTTEPFGRICYPLRSYL